METERIVRAVMDDMVQAARDIMDSDVGINEKVGKNTLSHSDLYKNIDTQIIQGSDNIVLRMMFNYYIEYIEWTRPKRYGKRPPVADIIVWLRKKKIPTHNRNIMSAAYAISYAIWRDGHKGRPIFRTLEEQLDDRWEKDWSETLFNDIIKELTLYFEK